MPIRLGLVAAFALFLIAPFHDKPIHVDDAIFLERGRAVWASQPKGARAAYNWTGTAESFSAHAGVMDPPAWPWLLGLFRAGHSDNIDRAWQVPFIVLALLCASVLAQRVAAGPWLSIVLLGFAPITWIPATSLTPDIACLSLGLLALTLLTGRPRRPGAGAVALFAAGSLKFTVAPLYALAVVGAPLATILAGLATLAWPAANIIANLTEGNPFLGATMRVQWGASWSPLLLFIKSVYGASSLSAAIVFPAVFWLLFLARVRHMRTAALLAPLGLLLASILLAPTLILWRGSSAVGRSPFLFGEPLGFTAAWFIFSLAGFGLWLGVLIARGRERGRRDTLWLLLWVGVVFAGLLMGTPFPACRFVLFAGPPIVFLVLRDLNRLIPRRALLWVQAATLVSTGWLGLNLAFSDDLFARCSASLVRTAWEFHGLERRNVYTTGHWGLQHEIEKRGGQILDIVRTRIVPGDILIVPRNTDHHGMGDTAQGVGLRLLEEWSCPPPDLALRTIDPFSSACFHGGHLWLPYSFSGQPLESLRVLEATPRVARQAQVRSRP